MQHYFTTIREILGALIIFLQKFSKGAVVVVENKWLISTLLEGVYQEVKKASKYVYSAREGFFVFILNFIGVNFSLIVRLCLNEEKNPNTNMQ
tara:strand:+ start:777 stop:1055 length:279 start_codon:yes stop_codon:yes gene_type:complete